MAKLQATYITAMHVSLSEVSSCHFCGSEVQVAHIYFAHLRIGQIKRSNVRFAQVRLYRDMKISKQKWPKAKTYLLAANNAHI